MMIVSENRFLLCRAQGGLNDILSEIGRCLLYAHKYNRTVIVETDYFDLNHFNDGFDNYFTSTDARLILDSTHHKNQFDQVSCFPKFIEGRVNSYTCFPETVGIEHSTHLPVIIDFKRDYIESLLVHHSNGHQKGRNALVCLQALQLKPKLLAILNLRLEDLGRQFQAIHIRHTDYKTTYKKRVSNLKQKLRGNVFIATDNRDVLNACRSILEFANILTFTDLPEDAGKPLHHLRSKANARQRNEDAILDLFTLTQARKYYFFPRQTNSFALRPSYSGFSVLVDRLRREPRLLHKILTGVDDTQLSNGNKFGTKLRELFGL